MFFKEFTGNTDRNTVVYHTLNPPIRARYIRFRPVAWKEWIAMRVELYDCLQGTEIVFISHSKVERVNPPDRCYFQGDAFQIIFRYGTKFLQIQEYKFDSNS